MKENRQTTRLEHLSDRLTGWLGSPASIVVHTIFFVGIFGLRYLGFATETILLILTTLVSLEAIYLAIFIQMTVNRHSKSLAEVEEDIDEIAEDVEDIAEDVEDISEDIDEIAEDIDRVEGEVGDISEDVDKIQEEDKDEAEQDEATRVSLEKIETVLQKLMTDIDSLKNRGH